MLAIVGQEGIGKSLTALKIAKAIDPEFDDGDVIFEAKELLRRLRDEDYREGQAIVLDEAGVSLGRRTWQDKGQIKVNQALQLIRSHNLAVIFTLPRLGELDSQSVARLQAFYEIRKKVPDEYVSGKWLYIDPDRIDSTGTNYHKYPKVTRPEMTASTIKVTRLKFQPPEGDWVDSYHERKQAHQKQVYDEAISELEDETDDGEDERTPKDVADEVLSEGVGPYISEHGQTGRKYVDKDLLRAEFDLSHSKANAAKKMIERETDEIE
jgi:ABC-type dipeptide/oligopeptide/nickel transport system ATPase component